MLEQTKLTLNNNKLNVEFANKDKSDSVLYDRSI